MENYTAVKTKMVKPKIPQACAACQAVSPLSKEPIYQGGCFHKVLLGKSAPHSHTATGSWGVGTSTAVVQNIRYDERKFASKFKGCETCQKKEKRRQDLDNKISGILAGVAVLLAIIAGIFIAGFSPSIKWLVKLLNGPSAAKWVLGISSAIITLVLVGWAGEKIARRAFKSFGIEQDGPVIRRFREVHQASIENVTFYFYSDEITYYFRNHDFAAEFRALNQNILVD
ncbi:hypothetical protein ACFLU6_01440 [Acidobacteriota bacterium]